MNYKWLFNQKQWREKWSDGFKVPKGKRICQPKILYTVKIILQKQMWNTDKSWETLSPTNHTTRNAKSSWGQRKMNPYLQEEIKKVSERTDIGQIKRHFYFSTFIIYIYVQFFKYQPPPTIYGGFYNT